VGVVDRPGVLRGSGYLSTGRWLVDSTGLSAREAKAQVARSRDLAGRFAATGVEWLAGRISSASARELTLGLGEAARHRRGELVDPALAEAEQVLLEIGRLLGPDKVRDAARVIKLAANPDGASAAEIAAAEDEFLRVIPVGDGFALSGYLTNEHGAALLTVLTGTAERMRAEGLFTPDPPVDPGTGLPDADVEAKTPAPSGAGRREHWLARALARVATDVLAGGGLPVVGGERPQVQVAVTLTDLRTAGVGQLSIPDICRSTSIGGTTTARISCDATLTPVLTTGDAYDGDGKAIDPVLAALVNPGWEVLAFGRKQRTIGTGLRKALIRRDLGCAFPGCHAPPEWTDAHHVHHWSTGGATDISNLVLLCERHHHHVHEGRWTITARTGSHPGRPGYWIFHPPEPRPRP
jgi:hypothetical protein